MRSPREKIPPLERVLLRLLLGRLFIPLLLLGLAVLCSATYFNDRTLKQHQEQTALTTAQMVDHYLKNGDRMLDALAKAAAKSPADLVAFTQSSWEAYGIFETIYYLDEKDTIVLLMPPDPRYQGMDMSNLPYFEELTESDQLLVSRPFISLRTGEPTVYLAKTLPHGRLIGALNLNGVQQQIEELNDVNRGNTVFILDQSGTLLAYPSAQQIRQQTNLSNLSIFQQGLHGNTTAIYQNNGAFFLASTAKTTKNDWIIITQTPLLASWGPYLGAFAFSLAIALLLWLAVWRSLSQSLRSDIVQPIEELSRSTAALACGDYPEAEAQTPPTFFAELNKLALDFSQMSRTLQARQEALATSEQRYRSLFAEVPIGLFRTMFDGQIIDANPAFQQMLAWPEQTPLSAYRLTDFYASIQDHERWQTLCGSNDASLDAELKMRRRDGRFIWVRLSMRGISASDGRAAFYDGSMEDITARKEAADALQSAHDRLEMKVELRTQELTSLNQELMAMNFELTEALDRLKKTQEILIHSEKRAALSNLVVGLAHEVNTPVGVAITVSSHLQELFLATAARYAEGRMKRSDFTQLLADSQESIELLLTSLNKAVQLIRNFKQVSVDQSGETRQRFIVREYLETLVNSLRSANPDFCHQIEILCAEHIELDSFPAAFSHIVTSLLLNCQHHAFAPQQCGKITLSVTFDANGSFILTCRDNGHGMSPEMREKIFDPFFTTRRGAGSIGLGLYIVYNIITLQLFGSITCQSEVGKGTSFVITLPSV